MQRTDYLRIFGVVDLYWSVVKITTIEGIGRGFVHFLFSIVDGTKTTRYLNCFIVCFGFKCCTRGKVHLKSINGTFFWYLQGWKDDFPVRVVFWIRDLDRALSVIGWNFSPFFQHFLRIFIWKENDRPVRNSPVGA